MKGLWAPGLGRYLWRRPASALILARAAWRLRREEWLRHPPFLPVPAPEYWQFRLATVNGSASSRLSPSSMVDAATWALRQPRGRS
ncbi:MAG: hypothetical protein ABSA07_09920 [Acidimicrobiales bacterium]